MIGFRTSLRHTCAAWAAFQQPPPSVVAALLTQTATTRPSCTTTAGPPRAASRLFSSSTDHSDTASLFQPAPPPGTHGTPVFPNIDLTNISPEAQRRNGSRDAVFVVTGANRGLGLQFAKSLLLERAQGTVIACCRDPDGAESLRQLHQSLDDPRRLHVVALDVQDQASIEAAGAAIRERFTRVDLLLNVAGILGDAKTTPGPERALQHMDRAWLEQTLAVNLVGPVMFTKELLPLLIQQRRSRRSGDGSTNGQEAKEQQQERPPAVVVNLSARVGSISDNRLGGWYSYRMSKAALNQATRTLALELQRHNAQAVALHPGTTDTDLSRPFQANVKDGSLFPVEFTVTQLLNLVDGMEQRHSGGFYDWSGQALSF